jgi:peptide/nickel transport system permease protein
MLTDTVKFARAAGESEWTILRQHVLRLISIPLVTVFGLEFGSTLAFARHGDDFLLARHRQVGSSI